MNKKKQKDECEKQLMSIMWPNYEMAIKEMKVY